MRTPHAPSVSFAVGRSRFLGWVLAALWLAALLVNALWFAVASPSDATPWLGLAAAGLCGVALRLSWQRQPTGRLSWDGRAWAWLGEGRLAQSLAGVGVVIDAPPLMLVQLQRAPGQPRLVWADAASDPRHWLDLRRALHARPHNQGSAATAADAQP